MTEIRANLSCGDRRDGRGNAPPPYLAPPLLPPSPARGGWNCPRGLPDSSVRGAQIEQPASPRGPSSQFLIFFLLEVKDIISSQSFFPPCVGLDCIFRWGNWFGGEFSRSGGGGARPPPTHPPCRRPGGVLAEPRLPAEAAGRKRGQQTCSECRAPQGLLFPKGGNESRVLKLFNNASLTQ